MAQPKYLLSLSIQSWVGIIFCSPLLFHSPLISWLLFALLFPALSVIQTCFLLWVVPDQLQSLSPASKVYSTEGTQAARCLFRKAGAGVGGGRERSEVALPPPEPTVLQSATTVLGHSTWWCQVETFPHLCPQLTGSLLFLLISIHSSFPTHPHVTLICLETFNYSPR